MSSRSHSTASRFRPSLLEFFSDRYLRPKYGNAVGMDSTFRLHSRIDTAILGVNQVTITQR